MSYQSKKLQAVKDGLATLYHERHFPQDRWAKAWSEDVMRWSETEETDELVTVYIFQAGHSMMPADYKQEFDNFEAFEKELRSFNSDLRRWSYYTEW